MCSYHTEGGKTIERVCDLMDGVEQHKAGKTLGATVMTAAGELEGHISRVRSCCSTALCGALDACVAILRDEAEEQQTTKPSGSETDVAKEKEAETGTAMEQAALWQHAHVLARCVQRLKPLLGDDLVVTFCGLAAKGTPLLQSLAGAATFAAARSCLEELAVINTSFSTLLSKVEADRAAGMEEYDVEAHFHSAKALFSKCPTACAQFGKSLEVHAKRLLECDLAGCGVLPRSLLDGLPARARALIETGVIVQQMPQLEELRRKEEEWTNEAILTAVTGVCSHEGVDFDLCAKLRADSSTVRDAMLETTTATLTQWLKKAHEAVVEGRASSEKYSMIVGVAATGDGAESCQS